MKRCLWIYIVLFSQLPSKKEWKGVFRSMSSQSFFFFFQCHNHEQVSVLLNQFSSHFSSIQLKFKSIQVASIVIQVLHSNMELNSHKINSLFSSQLMVTGSAQQHRFVITFMKDKLVRMLSWNCGCFLLTFVWPMYAWYSMLELSHLAWRARVRWNIMVLWLLGRTCIQTRISAEKVSEFDSLYFVRTLPLWVISVDYLFQRIGLISYTQAWLFLIEHCLRSWSLN